ncbi:nitrogen assimilation transcription factor nirA, partial [Podospora aff. communis PSN243]
CDGVRPICSACIRRKDRNCEYPVKEGAVSRLSDLRQNFEELERENHDFKDLFAYIRQKPENEAFELYRRLRMSEDPLKTLRQFRDAETLLALPTYATPSCTAEKFMHEIEADALAKSPLRVPARPWTSVAGDGLVSSLISSFFKWDDCIMYPFVDRDLFLRDMRNSEPSSSQYCSSLLVNIICATRSLMSDRVKFVRMTTGHDPGAAFLMEAKKHVDEELNKMCLTTVQGVYMLAVYCCCEGNSRAGSMYRFAALQMLRKMKPGALHAMLNANIPKEAELQRAFSKLCWGIFVFELMLAESSLSAPEMGPPPVPIIYDEESLMNHNLDVTGRSFITGSPEPPTAPGVFPAACEAARLYYDIQIYNQRPHGRVGCDPDMFQRHEIFKKLSNLELALPPRLDYRRNRAPGTMFLKLFLNMIALSILRPLPPSTPFQHDPSNPSRPCTTAKSLMIRLCAVDIEIVES